MIAIGLMSGTSLDGVDAALVNIEPSGQSYALDLVDFVTDPFDPGTLQALRAVLPPDEGRVGAVASLHRDLGETFARAALHVAGSHRVDYVASHGQTIWHDGPHRVTLQVGDPFAIRDVVGATVCYDFRSADCAAGGQGAPLVPYFDAMLLGSAQEDRVALNLGGVANVTLLPRAGGVGVGSLSAFDTGPGNMLVDAFVLERTGGDATFDRDGQLANGGRVDQALLEAILGDPYFSQAAPKTTGRERFGAQFLALHRERLGRLCLEDGAATLVEVTAVSVARAIARAGFASARVILSGGGACNPALVARIAARLPTARVETSDAMGIPVQAKEAMAFALLGYETLRGRVANVPSATGASRAVSLGAIAPHGLRELLGKVDAECNGSA